MIICRQFRTTSQGGATCHQPEGHRGDHIAQLSTVDGRWIASWSDRHPNHVDIRAIRQDTA